MDQVHAGGNEKCSSETTGELGPGSRPMSSTRRRYTTLGAKLLCSSDSQETLFLVERSKYKIKMSLDKVQYEQE